MKIAYILSGALAATLALNAHADVTVTVTGATAFRKATLDAIKAQYVASGQPFKYAHDRSGAAGNEFNNSTSSVWIGTFGTVSGTTTIRCTFNGSVEGLNALTSGSDTTTYLDATVLGSTTPTVGGTDVPNITGTKSASAPADMAFSDVNKASTPYAAASLLPTDARAGVVTFTMIANNGAPAGLTNVTSQQFKALFSKGFQRLKLFTGVASDNSYVFATGRNDGSGTRTTYLAETGYGITKLVNQYVAGVTTGTTISQIHLVPAGGSNPSIPGSLTANRSVIWGQDVDGNGGYNSGSFLRDDMGKTSTSCTVLDSFGDELFSAGPITLVTWLGTPDALAAKNKGAKILAYNGVAIDPISTGLNAADKAKVTEGQYTAWGYEQFYRRGDLVTGDKAAVYNLIKAAIPANLGSAGISLTDMHVSRTVDGGIVAP